MSAGYIRSFIGHTAVPRSDSRRDIASIPESFNWCLFIALTGQTLFALTTRHCCNRCIIIYHINNSFIPMHKSVSSISPLQPVERELFFLYFCLKVVSSRGPLRVTKYIWGGNEMSREEEQTRLCYTNLYLFFGLFYGLCFLCEILVNFTLFGLKQLFERIPLGGFNGKCLVELLTTQRHLKSDREPWLHTDKGSIFPSKLLRTWRCK